MIPKKSATKWRHPRFEYLEARTIEEACDLAFQNKGSARFIAGGTDLLPAMRRGKIDIERVINIKTISTLDYIHQDGQSLKIGALATLSDVNGSQAIRHGFPIISHSAGQIGTPQVRNMGTIGGNLCNAAPSADMAPSLIALGARVKIKGRQGERMVPLDEFFTGPGTSALREDEILTEIQVENLSEDTRTVYLKLPARTAKDIALVGVAAVWKMDSREIKIVLCAVAPTPMRARKAEAMLQGQRLSDKLVQEAARAAAEETKPLTDVRGSADHRREMVRVYTAQALRQVLAAG